MSKDEISTQMSLHFSEKWDLYLKETIKWNILCYIFIFVKEKDGNKNLLFQCHNQTRPKKIL